MKAIKLRIYPNEAQKVLIEKHFGCCRFIYNYALEKKIKHYQETQKSLSIYEISKELPILKKKEGTEWLKEVGAQVLQQSLNDLDSAFSSFFKKRAKFPRFKSKKREKFSFRFPQGFEVNPEKRYVDLPKIGIIKFRDKFDFKNVKEFGSLTVSRHAGKYYTSVSYEENHVIPALKTVVKDRTLGIDLGVKTLATFSSGEKIENPKFERQYREKLKFEQQKLERKQKDSRNRERQKLVVARIHDKIVNCRKDFLHKLTKRLVDNQDYDSFAVEDLSVKEMQKENFAACNRAINDTGFYRFHHFLDYKAKDAGKNVLVIGRFEASSKTCSCGVQKQDLTLEDREWTCSCCGLTHDRDILAANNIRIFALSNKDLRRDTPIKRVSRKRNRQKEPSVFKR